jgi:hypothetical protein
MYWVIHYSGSDSIAALVKAPTEAQALDRASDGLNAPLDDLEAFRLKHGWDSVVRIKQRWPGISYLEVS